MCLLVVLCNCRHCWESFSKFGRQLWPKICRSIMTSGSVGITPTITLWSCMTRMPSTVGLPPASTASRLSSQWSCLKSTKGPTTYSRNCGRRLFDMWTVLVQNVYGFVVQLCGQLMCIHGTVLLAVK